MASIIGVEFARALNGCWTGFTKRRAERVHVYYFVDVKCGLPLAMAKDMNFGGEHNKASMSRATESLDITDLYQNEESIDLSTYMTSANLELCDDDLFQSLFPTTTETDSNVKTEKPEAFEPELNDWWTDPSSAYPSACSSAAQSPVQFFNTPPVTPKSDAHSISPESFNQHRQDRQQQFSMSRTQLTPMMIMDEPSIVNNVGVNEVSPVPIKSEPDATQIHNVYFLQPEDDGNSNAVTTSALLPALMKAGPNKYEYIKVKKRPGEDDDDDDDNLSTKRLKPLDKGSDEYKMKRERNNIAVRKSRDKAKMKSIETQKKVSELSSENKRLHERVAELTHELNTLKNILKSLPAAHLPN